MEDEESSPEEELAVQEARDELAAGAQLFSGEGNKRELRITPENSCSTGILTPDTRYPAGCTACARCV